jgi:pyruvate dehydrogenase E2 component (dihydrolipoamide acetyltransferase)
MPALGADMDAGTLVEWMVAPGDKVTRGAIVAVVETQKGAIDVEIFESGTIVELVVPVGTTVPVGTLLATLAVEGEADDATPAAPAPPSTPPPSPSPPATVPPAQPSAEGLRVSPRARRRAAELGVDPAAAQPTGPDGSVTADDIDRLAAATTPESGSGMRSAIAAAMSRSNREIPHYYLGHTVDLEPALQWLESRNEDRPVRERLLPVALYVRALARALEKYPRLCGWYAGGAFVAAPAADVGLAVSRRDGGLLNPAIHDAGRGSLDELWQRIREVTERARAGALRASELADPAITLSSLGDRGVDTVFGVIHPPQVALVGIGTIRSRPWVVDGDVRPRRVAYVTLAADHRVTDGHLGARFLHHFANLLARPESL